MNLKTWTITCALIAVATGIYGSIPAVDLGTKLISLCISLPTGFLTFILLVAFLIKRKN